MKGRGRGGGWYHNHQLAHGPHHELYFQAFAGIFEVVIVCLLGRYDWWLLLLWLLVILLSLAFAVYWAHVCAIPVCLAQSTVLAHLKEQP